MIQGYTKKTEQKAREKGSVPDYGALLFLCLLFWRLRNIHVVGHISGYKIDLV